MIAAVKEAKLLWCCHNASHCRAYGCMTWRWFDQVQDDEADDEYRRGYCGLVGRPEFEF